MDITVRPAVNADIKRLTSLYRDMEAEQTSRKPIWALTDGLDGRTETAFARAMTTQNSWVDVGAIDGAVVGFIHTTIAPMLRQADGTRMGVVHLIYTEPEARGVGVGHAMLEHALSTLRAEGLTHFDAPVGPGQRAAKNFFESHGFAARSIVMYHADD